MGQFVGRVYLEGPPSLANLARDFDELAAEGGWPDETPAQALERVAIAKRLRRAVTVERESGGRLGMFILRRGVLKYGVWIAVALMAVTLLRPGNWTARTSAAEIGTLLLIAGSVGLILAAMQWSSARDALLWAEAFRDEYHAVQQRMLRPEGDDGSRIVRNAAGTWELIEDSQV